MENIIYQTVALLVSVGAFLLGKYVFPNVPKSVADKLRRSEERHVGKEC